MSEKKVAQTLERFKGLDLYSSDLTRDFTYAKSLMNWRFGEGRGLKSRYGEQIVGQNLGASAIGKAHFFDGTTGATTETLLAMNKALWKLVASSFTITRTGGSTTWYYTISLDAATGRFRFRINQGGSDITLVHPITGESNTYLDLGTGFEEHKAPTSAPTSGVITILDLCKAIDNHANFAAGTSGVPPRTARVNGSVTSTTVTVDAGHTISAKDLVFWEEGANGFVWAEVESTTATTITFSLPLSAGSYSLGPGFNFLNDQVLGVGSAPAVSTDFRKNGYAFTTQEPSASYPFYYFNPIYQPDGTDGQLSNTAPFRSSGTKENFVSTGNSVYIFKGATNSNAKNIRPYEGYHYKYDGRKCYRAGMPPYVATIGTSLGGTGLTGRYRYAVRYAYKDARGVWTYGNPSSFYNVTEANPSNQTVTLTLTNTRFNVPAANKITSAINNVTPGTSTVPAGHKCQIGDWFIARNITAVDRFVLSQITSTTDVVLNFGVEVDGLRIGESLYKDPPLGFDYTGTRTNGAQAGKGASGTPLTVDAGTFQVGDVVYFYDSLRGIYVERELTVVTATTIAWDTTKADTVSVVDNSPISTIRIEIYRTKANGNKFYLHTVVPSDPETPTFSFADSTADSALGVEAIFPEIGAEDDLAPRSAYGCSHQGRIVMSGAFDNPNSIFWSKSDYLESFPAANNGADIPSTVEGPITGIASDNDDNLAVFKERGYYTVQGDLDGGVAASPVYEGDYGITSHASIARIDGWLTGLSKLGIIRVSEGELDSEFYKPVSPMLIESPNSVNNAGILYTTATAINYGKQGELRMCVAYEDIFQSDTTKKGYKEIVYDYRNGEILESAYRTGFAATGGYAVVGGKLYTLSLESTDYRSANNHGGMIYREMDFYTSFPEIQYADQHKAIKRKANWLWHLGKPSLDKAFLRLKLWATYLSYFNVFTANNLTVTTYRDFQTSSSNESFTLSFTSATDFEKKRKLKSGSSRALEIQIDNEELWVTPYLTGIELLIAETHEQEDI